MKANQMPVFCALLMISRDVVLSPALSVSTKKWGDVCNIHRKNEHTTRGVHFLSFLGAKLKHRSQVCKFCIFIYVGCSEIARRTSMNTTQSCASCVSNRDTFFIKHRTCPIFRYIYFQMITGLCKSMFKPTRKLHLQKVCNEHGNVLLYEYICCGRM